LTIHRAQRRHYLNIGTANAPVWAPIGEGFTEFREVKHPISYGRRYIHESIRRTDVTGFAPAVDYAFEVCTNDPVISLLRRITDTEKVGRDAWVDICTVDLFENTDIQGVYPASCRTYTVVPDTCGEGTDTLLYTGTLKAVTSPLQGTFVLSTCTFMQ